MKKETLFRKVLVSERVPTVYGEYNTDTGLMEYSPYPGNGWLCYPNPEPKEYWLEEIQIPSEGDIKTQSLLPYTEKDLLSEEYGHFLEEDSKVFIEGAHYILGFINNKK